MEEEIFEIEKGWKKYQAVKAILIKNDKILLLKLNPKYLFLGGLWEVPGGRKKHGESDENTLKREVREEVGMEIEIIKLINSWKQLIPEKTGILEGKTFLCKPLSKEVILNNPEKQHLNYKWVSTKDAKKFRIPPWLRESLEKIKI